MKLARLGQLGGTLGPWDSLWQHGGCCGGGGCGAHCGFMEKAGFLDSWANN